MERPAPGDAALAAHRPPRRAAAWRELARALPLAGGLGLASAAGLLAQQRSPLDSISRLPGAAAERDTTPLLAPARLARLPARERAAWQAYLRRSRELAGADRAFMAAELARVGRTRMTQAPYIRYFTLEPHMKGAWFASDSARALALRLLSWQTTAGGWSKHVDMAARARLPGESFYGESDEWHYIATFDNDATTTQLRIIAGVVNTLPGPGPGPKKAADAARLRTAFLRGLDFVFAAQFPNGCFPQVYPLQGGYHDAATFNDNATVNVLRLLRDVAAGDYAFVPGRVRRRAGDAFERGLDCVLRSQVVVNGATGARTVWGQQHDPLTLRPAPARSYELAGLAGRESAWILDFLMELRAPSPRVVAAVHAGAAWFRAHEIHDWAYGDDQVLRPSPGAGPIWARNTDLATMRPMFANRDGIKLFDWNRLTDRRAGYGWFGTEPARTLRTYGVWARRHPLEHIPHPEEAP